MAKKKKKKRNTRIEGERRKAGDLQGGVEALAVAELADGDADLPFEDAFAALEEVVELPPDARRRAPLPEEPVVQRILQVLARPLRHQLRTRRHRKRLLSPPPLSPPAPGFQEGNGFAGPASVRPSSIKYRTNCQFVFISDDGPAQRYKVLHQWASLFYI